MLLKAVKNLVFANQALMLFVDHARDQLWSKWSVGTIMDGKVGTWTYIWGAKELHNMVLALAIPFTVGHPSGVKGWSSS